MIAFSRSNREACFGFRGLLSQLKEIWIGNNERIERLFENLKNCTVSIYFLGLNVRSKKIF